EAHADQIGLFLERLELSEEARRTQVELETERVRNAILSSVSHDLRTPLGSVMGAASTLHESDDRLDTSQRRKLAETIHRESRRLDRLLENLLKMTHIEDDELSVEPEWQIPGEVARTAASHLGPELENRSVNIDAPGPDEIGYFDGPLVEQALVNLLENAARHTPDGTDVDLSVRVDGEAVAFEVRDRGPGIPPAERGRLTEKFEQGTAGSDRGSGLGLTIVDAIVEAHGGELDIASADGGSGTAVTFRLPRPRTPSVDVPDAEPSPVPDENSES
ncbi:MAG: sensor histidine kinase, partial [Bradymonadaceae bacterium]